MRKITQINIPLTEEHFRKLVNGEVVTINHHSAPAPINIALKDIGFDRIMDAVSEAMQKAGN